METSSWVSLSSTSSNQHVVLTAYVEGVGEGVGGFFKRLSLVVLDIAATASTTTYKLCADSTTSPYAQQPAGLVDGMSITHTPLNAPSYAHDLDH